jgi:DNA modification methylase
LDPFLGIGNSATAAQKTGVRRFIGFDIDADYLSVAAKKLNTVVRQSVQQADNLN